MYKKILAPFDSSELSECSVEHIKAIASGCNVPEVVLLTVIERVVIPFSETIVTNEAMEQTKQYIERERQTQLKTEEYLNKLASSLSKQCITVQTTVIPAKAGQSPADIILDYVDNNSVDLIIMSTHGRSGAARWAFGSVTDKVMRHSKVPVLTVAPASCRVS
ncbi:universal stress protein [Chloroflexota bacterium]